jgi:hypothetical protein
VARVPSCSVQNSISLQAERLKDSQGLPGVLHLPVAARWRNALAFDPFRLLALSLAGWLNQCQQEAIDYLEEKDRALREEPEVIAHSYGDQYRRLAMRAEKQGRNRFHDEQF